MQAIKVTNQKMSLNESAMRELTAQSALKDRTFTEATRSTITNKTSSSPKGGRSVVSIDKRSSYGGISIDRPAINVYTEEERQKKRQRLICVVCLSIFIVVLAGAVIVFVLFFMPEENAGTTTTSGLPSERLI